MPNIEEAAEAKIAMLIDFENVAISVQEQRNEKFEIGLILDRLADKGKVIIKKAYGEWNNFPKFLHDLQDNAVELIEMPVRGGFSKNGSDIRMSIDAMEIAFNKGYIDTFAIVSGDSDFSSLVMKLREYNKYVIGIGLRKTTSNLLVNNCDEFIFYESLLGTKRKSKREFDPKFELLMETLDSLDRENVGSILSARLKSTMLRKNPAFSEATYGYKSFRKYLEAAQAQGLIKLERDEKSRDLKVVP